MFRHERLLNCICPFFACESNCLSLFFVLGYLIRYCVLFLWQTTHSFLLSWVLSFVRRPFHLYNVFHLDSWLRSGLYPLETLLCIGLIKTPQSGSKDNKARSGVPLWRMPCGGWRTVLAVKVCPHGPLPSASKPKATKDCEMSTLPLSSRTLPA